MIFFASPSTCERKLSNSLSPRPRSIYCSDEADPSLSLCLSGMLVHNQPTSILPCSFIPATMEEEEEGGDSPRLLLAAPPTCDLEGRIGRSILPG